MKVVNMYFKPLGKRKRFIFHFKQGIQNRYPICCTLRWSIQDAWEDGKILPIEQAQGMKRGCVYRGDRELDDVFVPCGIFHHKTEDVDVQ